MGGLFDLDEVIPDWEPIYDPLPYNTCRDCGAVAGYLQGGARPGLGIFMVCNDCAQLDGLEEREPGLWASRWGDTSDPSDHDTMLTEQARRRRNYHERRR